MRVAKLRDFLIKVLIARQVDRVYFIFIDKISSFKLEIFKLGFVIELFVEIKNAFLVRLGA